MLHEAEPVAEARERLGAGTVVLPRPIRCRASLG